MNINKLLLTGFMAASCGLTSAQLPCTVSEMQRAYDNCFSEEATLARYALADIDGDGIPEVFLSNYDGEDYQGNGDCRAVFVCHNGKLTMIEQTAGMTGGCSDYEFCINKKEHLLYYKHSNQGSSEEYVYFLKNSNVTHCVAKETNVEWIGEGEDMTDTYKFYYFYYPIGANGYIDFEKRREVRKKEVEPYLEKFGFTTEEKDDDKLIWKKIK